MRNFTFVFIFVFTLIFSCAPLISDDTNSFEKDSFETENGTLEITFIGHGTLMFEFAGKIIHVDPWTRLADYSQLPDPDIILITHEHSDHLDIKALHFSRKNNTDLVYTELCSQKASSGTIMRNGDVMELKGIKIEAVPAYNIKHQRSPGHPFHPKGDGNGYILTFGDNGFRVYIAGDTENIPEMSNLKDIDAAFLPMNIPYTMTPEMAADAAKTIRPAILYPYHFGDTDTSLLTDLLKDEQSIEVRIRKLK